MNRITNTFSSVEEKYFKQRVIAIQMWGCQSDEDIELDLFIRPCVIVGPHGFL